VYPESIVCKRGLGHLSLCDLRVRARRPVGAVPSALSQVRQAIRPGGTERRRQQERPVPGPVLSVMSEIRVPEEAPIRTDEPEVPEPEESEDDDYKGPDPEADPKGDAVRTKIRDLKRHSSWSQEPGLAHQTLLKSGVLTTEDVPGSLGDRLPCPAATADLDEPLDVCGRHFDPHRNQATARAATTSTPTITSVTGDTVPAGFWAGTRRRARSRGNISLDHFPTSETSGRKKVWVRQVSVPAPRHPAVPRDLTVDDGRRRLDATVRVCCLGRPASPHGSAESFLRGCGMNVACV
jgi:hypothetical protein